jgi:putative CocE/NonD family hydrolase
MKRMQPMIRGPDLAKSIKHHFDGQAPWMEYVVDHPDIETRDLFYEKMNFEQALERANIPILLVGGWYDVFAPQTLRQYARLSERGTNVTLMMGPWNHTQVGMQAEVHKQSYNWIEQHLVKRSVQAQKIPVQYFVTGAKEWRHEATWPPPTVVLEWYLGSGQLLTTQKATEEGLSSFVFDPKDPTPTVGGNLLLLGGGSVDDTALAARSDVLAFTTEPLENDVEVAGKIVVQLSHASDNPDVDLFVRISEVDAKGRSHNITETYRRLSATSEAQILVLHLNDCAHRFTKGCKIRLLIAGASFPQYAVNAGSGVDETSVQWKSATHTVHYGGECTSKILLPVVA